MEHDRLHRNLRSRERIFDSALAERKAQGPRRRHRQRSDALISERLLQHSNIIEISGSSAPTTNSLKQPLISAPHRKFHSSSVNLPLGQAIRLIHSPVLPGDKDGSLQGARPAEWTFKPAMTLGLLPSSKGRETLLKKIAASPRDLQVYLAEAAKIAAGRISLSRCASRLVLDSDQVPLIRERLCNALH
jgi:hypothetical protein